MGEIERYCVPKSLAEAASLLREGPATILAGGTDLSVQSRGGDLQIAPTLVNIRRVAELAGISREGQRFRIGALTTVTDILQSPAVNEHLAVLARAADCFASNQIRNMATIGGNICNASPAGDMIVPLMLLDAEVELASWAEGALALRSMPLAEFFLGPGKTRREPGELLAAVHVPVPGAEFTAGFEKFGTRPALDISIVSVGIGGSKAKGGLENPRVVFGAVAPVPMRGVQTEAAIEGRTLDPPTIAAIARTAESEVRPITDVRASGWYRKRLVRQLTERLLHHAAAN